MSARNRFEGKVALLTGSASSMRGERMGFGGVHGVEDIGGGREGCDYGYSG